MPAPTPPVEGTGNSPKDTGNRYFQGVWNAVAGFLAQRGTPDGHAIIQIEKGSRTHFVPAVAPTGTPQVLRLASTTRRSVSFINWGAATVFVGKDSSVTTVNGTPMPQYATWTDLDGTEDWWGITTGAAADVRGWETS